MSHQSHMQRARGHFSRHSKEDVTAQGMQAGGPEPNKGEENQQKNVEQKIPENSGNTQNVDQKNQENSANTQGGDQQNQQTSSEKQGEIKVEDKGQKEWKEENDLPLLLKRMGESVKNGQDPHHLVDEWISEKEKKLTRWRRGLKSGAGAQTFSLGLVTFGLGPIPINMGIMAGLNKHIVHTFTLDDERVDHFVKSSLGYGAKELTKKLGIMLAKTMVMAGSSSVGIVPLIGPAISATMTAHKISKTAKKTTKECSDLVREICQAAINENKFDL